MIKDVHFVRKRGKQIRWYVYAYRGGPCVLKSVGPKRPTLGPLHVSAIVQAQNAKTRSRVENTLTSLIRTWRSEDPNRPSSPEWDALSANTKKTWASALRKIEDKFGHLPISVFNDPRMKAKIVEWRNTLRDRPRAADIAVTVLRALLKFGALHGHLGINVAADIPSLYRGGDRSEIIWTEADLAAFTRKAEELGIAVAADGLRLAAATGLRREDLVTLTAQHVEKFAIVKKALKRSGSRRRRRFASIPRIPELDSLLADLAARPRKPGVETVLVGPDGGSWTPDRLTKAIAKVRDELGIVYRDPETGQERKKHLHDARGTYATRLMVCTDLDDREVADIMGWAPEEVATVRKLYVDQTAVMMAIGQRIDRGV